MNPGQTINIQLTTGENKPFPIHDVLVLINLFTGGTYRYGFVAGRTDKEGRLNVSYDDLEKLRRANAQEFLMDCNTKLEDCDPLVQIVVPSVEDLLARKAKVLENFGRAPDWAMTWPSNAKVKAQESTVKLVGQTVDALIPVG
jgi:hypothetical protein